MTTGIVQDKNPMEKQMGCMAGFFQIFDRHQILAGKRLNSTKRLPSSSAASSTPESEKSVDSSLVSRELEKQQEPRSSSSPDRLKTSELPEVRTPAPETATPVETPTKSPSPFPIFELKDGTKSSWKFCKDAPRLSLDSRAVVDAKGSLKPREIRTSAAFLSSGRCDEAAEDSDNQRKSPSVIARLMGLEQLPQSDPEPAKKAELRRSASESRVSRDLFQHRFIDCNNNFNFPTRQTQQPNSQFSNPRKVVGNNVANAAHSYGGTGVDSKELGVRSLRCGATKAAQCRGIGQRKSFFDSADFFPEPKQSVSIYGEIEKRLRMRGIEEPSKDLETLKHILEALQLKGLLHSKKTSNQMNQRNFVYDHRSLESPIVVMKPTTRSPVNRPGRSGNDSPPSSFRSRPGARRHVNETLPAVSPRRDRTEFDRNGRHQTRDRNRSGATSPNRRRPLSIETQRTGNGIDTAENRRISPVQSPKVGARRAGSDQQITTRSPRMKQPTAERYRKDEKAFASAEDESSTAVSESAVSTSSQTDTERSKSEEYKEGRSLLERCDKLLSSIAELQPSPVSVLDSSFYKDESSSPSPVMKRSIDFKDQTVELEDDIWSLAMSYVESNCEGKSGDWDYEYISEILRASNYLPEDSDIFLLLEKQQYLKGKDTSDVPRLQRRLIFDTINEILNRNRQLPPWKPSSWTNSTSLQQIWSEYQRIRERDDAAEDLLEEIRGVLRKDLVGDGVSGWVDSPIEMSEAVLDIERLIFKDLIGETIRDLAVSSPNCSNALALRRKLVF